MKGRLGRVASPQIRLSAHGRMPSGRLEPARRAPRRKTADLYFFVEGAAGRPGKSRLRSLYRVYPLSARK